MNLVREDLQELLKDKTRQEVADTLGVSLWTVRRAIKRLGVTYQKKTGLRLDIHRQLPTSLTPIQQEVMTGCLLGDSFVDHLNRFNIKQKLERREYIEHLGEVFTPFTMPICENKSRRPKRVNGRVSHRIEDWDGTYLWNAQVYTRKTPIFVALRQKWYPHGKKEVPSDLKLTPLTLAHWYCQDGNNNQERKQIKLDTDAFTEIEIDFLIECLRSQFSLCCRPYQRDSRHMVILFSDGYGHKGYYEFLETVRPYMTWKCFEYKMDTSRTNPYPSHPGPKLNFMLAQEIRSLFATGEWTQAELGKKYDVHQVTISEIVRFKTFAK